MASKNQTWSNSDLQKRDEQANLMRKAKKAQKKATSKGKVKMVRSVEELAELAQAEKEYFRVQAQRDRTRRANKLLVQVADKAIKQDQLVTSNINKELEAL